VTGVIRIVTWRGSYEGRAQVDDYNTACPGEGEGGNGNGSGHGHD